MCNCSNVCGGFWCGRWLVVKFGVSWRFLSWAGGGGVVCLGRVVECKLERGEGGERGMSIQVYGLWVENLGGS